MRSADYLTAVGIGVSDLERSARFYKQALGMQETRRFKLAHMDEILLVHEGRNAVVLMHWTDGSARTYADLPIKLVFQVQDPAAVAERIRAEGLDITQEPQAFEGLGGALVCLARDPDGYVIELLGAPPAS